MRTTGAIYASNRHRNEAGINRNHNTMKWTATNGKSLLTTRGQQTRSSRIHVPVHDVIRNTFNTSPATTVGEVGNWQFWMSEVSSFGAWLPDGRLYSSLRMGLVSLRVCSGPQQTRLFTLYAAARKILTEMNAGFSNQRLEALGGACLKLGTSVNMLIELRYYREGELLSLRLNSVCNAYLICDRLQ
jgi:hypothetical protein